MSKPYKHNGLWVQAIELPPIDGKRRRKTVAAKDKGTLIRKVRALELQLAEHGDLPTANMTVTQWFDYWMREIAVKTRRPKTVASYRSIVNQQILPVIGKVRLDKLAPSTIRKVTVAMDAAGKSTTYQRNTHSIMSAAFKDAEREGRIRRNPVELVTAPRKARTELKALTAEEAVALIGALADSPDRFLWVTFLLTGARRGEIIGLEWDRLTSTMALDPETGAQVEYRSLDLSWQLQRIGHGQAVPADFESRHISGGLYLTRPKSRAGWRVVPLVQPLAGYLDEWRSIAPHNPWGLVFTREDEDGNIIPLDPDYITRAWKKLADSLGHKGVRLHDLRHTTVDMLYAAGIPEQVISAIVGHSAVTMTRAYRSRGDEVRERAAMNELTKYLGLDA